MCLHIFILFYIWLICNCKFFLQTERVLLADWLCYTCCSTCRLVVFYLLFYLQTGCVLLVVLLADWLCSTCILSVFYLLFYLQTECVLLAD